MAIETSALRGEPQQAQMAGNAAESLVEADYQSFSAALGASARGRAFLHEYAKRNRHADTEVVLAALDRLETVARSQKIAPEAERIRQDLRALLDTIRSARPQIDSTPGAIKAATLAALIEFVQARIEALVQPTNAPLASVPEPEQPELPIPQPGTAAQRTIALVRAIAPQSDAAPAAVAAPASSAPEAFVLKLDPRVAPAARNFDPDSNPYEPPRSTKIIPEVNFIDSLFDAIDAKSKAAKAEIKAQMKAASQGEVAAPPVAVAEPAAALPIESAAVTAAKLPIEMPGPVPALAGATTSETIVATAAEVAAAAEAFAVTETANEAGTLETASADDSAAASLTTVAAAQAVTRPVSATAAAINASANAIDDIIAAAQAALEQAALEEAATSRSGTD